MAAKVGDKGYRRFTEVIIEIRDRIEIECFLPTLVAMVDAPWTGEDRLNRIVEVRWLALSIAGIADSAEDTAMRNGG